MYAVKITLALMLFAFMSEAVLGRYVEDYLEPSNYGEDNFRYRLPRSPQGQTSLTGSHSNGVTSLRGDIQGTLMKTDHSTLGGSAYYQRNWGGLAPKYETGAGLNYNRDNGFHSSVNYNKMPGSSSLGAKAGYDFYRSNDGSTRFGADAFYNRNFGGFGPRQNYGGMVFLRKTF